MTDFNNNIEYFTDHVPVSASDGRYVDHQTFSLSEFLKILSSLLGGAAMLLRGGSSTLITGIAKVQAWVKLPRS